MFRVCIFQKLVRKYFSTDYRFIQFYAVEQAMLSICGNFYDKDPTPTANVMKKMNLNQIFQLPIGISLSNTGIKQFLGKNRF